MNSKVLNYEIGNRDTRYIYSIGDIVSLVNHPQLNTRNKMFSFLRKYGMLNNMLPLPELISKGYFTIEFHHIKNGNFSKTVQVVRVSPKGVKFLIKFAKLIFE